MRIESCRTCGQDMQEFQRCHACNEVIRLICRTCNKASDSQVHVKCGTLGKVMILN